MAADQRPSIPDVRAVNPCSRNHLAGGRAGSPRDAGTQLSLSPRARDRAIKEADFDAPITEARGTAWRVGPWVRVRLEVEKKKNWEAETSPIL